MKIPARIISVFPDRIEAALEQIPACAGCQSGCAQQSFKWLNGSTTERLVIYRQAVPGKKQSGLVDQQDFFSRKTQAGDRFWIEFDENSMLQSAFFLYAMPLLMLLLGLTGLFALFSALAWPADLGGFTGAVLGLGLARWRIKNTTSGAITGVRFS